MAIFLRRKGYVFFTQPQVITSFFFKRSNCALAEGEMGKHFIGPPVDTSTWKKVNARALGVKASMISLSSWTVLRVLRNQGFEAYLVGGCVRDLLLKRVPKDFDVITTATLKQIRQQFNRAQIIGKRFPICQVWIRGSITEVSSFDTVALNTSENEDDSDNAEGKDDNQEDTEDNEGITPFDMPWGFNEKDYNRWRNSIHRDFTINRPSLLQIATYTDSSEKSVLANLSLFLDPFDFRIYDYTKGIEDLKALKLRTLIPAHLSFKEDCARILRGLRIAARLDLSFSKDVEIAIPEFVSSVANLDQFRLMMEMNYMLSYGAAGPSILLLGRFNLLRILLPFQAAYLEKAGKDCPMSSLMLMRLLSNMDKLVFCDQPADCRLWIALLAFHTALVRNREGALVVCAFASVLYHGHWKEAVKFAREHEKSLAKFAPEISKSSENISNEELAEAVTLFAFSLQNSLHVLTEVDDLREAMSAYSNSDCSGLVFVPKRRAREVSNAFDDMANDIKSYEIKRERFSIDYHLLGRGDPEEMKFVLGKIILDTMTMTEEATVKQIDSVDKESNRKLQKFAKKKDPSTLSKPVKNIQPCIGEEEQHRQLASVPERKQKTSKRSRAKNNECSQSKSDTASDKVEAVKGLSSNNLKTLPSMRKEATVKQSDLVDKERNHKAQKFAKKYDSSARSNLPKYPPSLIKEEEQHGQEASVPEPKRKTSEKLRATDNKFSKSKRDTAANNVGAVVESLCDNNLETTQSVPNNKSISKLLDLVVRSDIMTQANLSEEKYNNNSSVSAEDESGRAKTGRPRKRPAVGKLSSLFR